MENASNVAFALRLFGLREATEESGEISNVQSFLVVTALVAWRLAAKTFFSWRPYAELYVILIHRHFIQAFATVPLHM